MDLKFTSSKKMHNKKKYFCTNLYLGEGTFQYKI